MKNVFSYPGDKFKNPKCDGEQFVTASLDDNFKRTREKIYSKAKMTREAVTLPIIANAIAWASFAIFAIIAFMFFKDVYKLGVPQDYATVDVMAYYYKPAKSKLSLGDRADGIYYNDEMKLFCKDDELCLADDERVFSFPIKDFVRYYLGSEKLPLAWWNKEINYDEGEYLQYGIKTKYTDMACLCYSLQFVCDSEVYEIIFPEYELEHFQKLVDVPVEFDE